jgi:dipeptidyl aminopeptidase/acylaminoacyl peptidase
MKRLETAAVTALAAAFALAGCERDTGSSAQNTSGTPRDTSRIPRYTSDNPRYSIQEFLGTTTYGGGAFSPDNEKILVSSDQTGVFNAYAIPVDGGEPVQLTHSSEAPIRAVSYFPNDERFLYQGGPGGNVHLYVWELDGTSVDLTPGVGHQAAFHSWSKDRRYFYVATNERDAQAMDLYEYSAADYGRELIFENRGGYGTMIVSPDRRYIALSKTVSNADSDVYVYDRESEVAGLITPEEGDVYCVPQDFSPDGSLLYYTTNLDNEFTYVERYDLRMFQPAVVIQTDWDVVYARFSNTGRYFMYAINNDGRQELRLFDGATSEPVRLPTVPDAQISWVGFSDDDSRMHFYATGSRIPRDLYVYDLDGSEPRRLTRSLNANIDADQLVEGEVVRFESYDGVEIPGILYKPHGVGPAQKAPAVIWVHGGPGGQSRIVYNGLIQYLVYNGYVVYAINHRGSTGYGKTFYHMDDHMHGDADLDDCVASKQMLIETGYVDPERIGIIGGSYGGYMVLAALAFRPQEFAVGVDLFGTSNWLRTVQSIPAWWGAQRGALQRELGDFDDEAFFKAKSPLFHADKIVRPLMVLQGANDPRVLKAESDEIVEALRSNGVPVEYLVFDDEGHGFVRRENQERGYVAVLEFLEQHLRGETGEGPGG